VAPKQDEVVRIRLRYPDLDTFVARFAPNVTRGGIFLASRDPRPVGEVLRFEVSIRNGGGPLLTGEGRVTWVKPYIPEEPHKPYGMGVQFIYVDPEVRPLLDRLLQKREGAAKAAAPVQQPTAPVAYGSSGDNRPTQPQTVVLDAFDKIEEAVLRRTLDRARVLAARTEDVEMLLTSEPQAPATLTEALEDLPRLLAGGRRTTVTLPAAPDGDKAD